MAGSRATLVPISTLDTAMASLKIPVLGECSLMRLLAIIARVALGGFLIYMGLAKILAPSDFLKLLREYHFLPSPWPLNAVAAILPWFEVFCGVLLLAGIAVRGAAAIVAALFLGFTIAITLRALDLQVQLQIPFCALKFDCGCGAGEVYVCRKLTENLIWLALAIWLTVSRHTSWKTFPWK